jgi:endonuclease YncB( thermonuclease family)
MTARRRTVQPTASASESTPAPTPSRRSAPPHSGRREPFAVRFWLAAAAVVMLLSACSPRHKQLFADAPSHPVPQVLVVESDALVIDGRHVRLSNAAGPQAVPHAACWAEAVAAHEARESVRALVTGAQDITVTPTGGVDEYNRAWAHVSIDGLDLGLTLLQRGLAAPRNDHRFDWCAPLSTSVGQGPSISALAALN